MLGDAPVRITNLCYEDLDQIESIEEQTNLGRWDRRSYRQLIADEGCVLARVAEVEREAGGRKIVGFIIARFVGDQMEVMKIAVAPEFQGRGIGQELMRVALSEAERRGARDCFLEVRRSNVKAIRFYQSLKFEIFGLRRSYYTNPIEDAYVMRKKL